MDEDYDTKADQIRQLAGTDPAQLSEHLTNMHNTLDSAVPNIAPHVYATAANAISFLSQKLPKNGDNMIQEQLPSISKAQKNQWLNLHKIVNDPLTIMTHVENGTLNKHHLEAIKAVYPDIYKEMSLKMMEHLGQLKQKKEQLKYKRRISIAKFLGSPLDATMTQAHMQAILTSAGPNTGEAAQASGKGPKKASNAAVSQVNKVNQIYPTATQNLELRKRK